MQVDYATYSTWSFLAGIRTGSSQQRQASGHTLLAALSKRSNMSRCGLRSTFAGSCGHGVEPARWDSTGLSQRLNASGRSGQKLDGIRLCLCALAELPCCAT
eukprot:849801-Rhodomonas_salina.1